MGNLIVDLVIGAANLGLQTYGTLKQMKNQQLAVEYANKLKLLSSADQYALNQKILNAKSDNQRLEILANAIVEIDKRNEAKKTIFPFYVLSACVGLLIIVLVIRSHSHD